MVLFSISTDNRPILNIVELSRRDFLIYKILPESYIIVHSDSSYPDN